MLTLSASSLPYLASPGYAKPGHAMPRIAAPDAIDRTNPKRWVKAMNENEVISLVRGLAPRIREIVADAVKLPPELAGQVALAVRMLHESPEIEQRSKAPPPPPKVTRIERDADGNFVPVYDETQP